MKKIALALLCVFATGSAAAQTYACQFIMTAGMDKDPKSGWRATEFKVREPFFLTMSGGVIDTKSLIDPATKMHPSVTKCFKTDYDDTYIGFSHWCASDTNYLSFSEKTLNGGLAKTLGALQASSDPDVDTVTIARFKCQKVR